MKLGSYKVSGNASYGIVTENGIIDLASKLGMRAPTLRDFIAIDLDGATDIAATAKIDYQTSDVEWLPVIPDPGAVWCCGLNTHSHFHETKHIFQREAPPDVPMFFLRSRHTLVAAGQPMEKPALETDFDYEGEVALIIGKRCRNVSVENALQHVAGYTCFNDGSARQYQIRSHQATTGKNAYHSGGFGPWMATSDAVDLDEMALETRVNGEVRQRMRLDDLIFSFADLISHISEVTWLEPGDVIVTGSPEGAGALRDPRVFLREGDIVEVEVSGIGTLTNPVIEQQL